MPIPTFSQLRWSCRRGMLELDVLLGYFLEEVFLTLPLSEQTVFISLLNESDQDLFMWLTGQSIPYDKDFVIMIGKIQHHAKNRHHY